MALGNLVNIAHDDPVAWIYKILDYVSHMLPHAVLLAEGTLPL